MTTPQTSNPRPRLHPLLAAAALSVIGVSALGAVVLVSGQVSASHSAAPEVQVVDASKAATPTPLAQAPEAPVASAPAPVATPKPVIRPAPVKTPARPAPQPVAAPDSTPAVAPVASTLPPLPPIAQPLPRETSAPTTAAVCRECGTVTAIREVKVAGQANGVGAIGGAVVGGVIGNQIGRGNGRDVARILGAVGGAVAGHQIERQARATTRYEIDVALDDGGTQTIRQDAAPDLRNGERVRVTGNRLTRTDGAPIAVRAPVAPAAHAGGA